jgi:aspartate kinase
MSERTILLKFGGTSLATPARVRLAARRVRSQLHRGRRVAVVVSANGHATDHILARLGSLTGGAGTATATRESDRALATGEDLSATLFAVALTAAGVPARSLRGGEAGVVAEGEFGAGRIVRVDPRPIQRLLDAGSVPVISGFQGRRADGETVTLGRGGSDTSAVAIAAALGPAPCHIITDVNAVYDRDPRLHRDAVPLHELAFDDLVGIVEAGAQVVHPAAAKWAERENVPLRVYHYRAPLSGRGGTRVGTAADDRSQAKEAAA